MQFEAQRTGLPHTWHIVIHAKGRPNAISSMLPHCFGEDEQLCREVAREMNRRLKAGR